MASAVAEAAAALRDAVDNAAGGPAAAAEGSLALLGLKSATREAYEGTESAREETAKAKAALDRTHLTLRNLEYEKRHHGAEIAACRAFKSAFADADIGLVPIEEFRATAPGELLEGVEEGDTHTLELKRLAFELSQRQDGCARVEALKKRKAELAATIAERRSFLNGLGDNLRDLKKASIPLQEQLEVPRSRVQDQHRLARLLPPPLYVAYTQLDALRSAFDEPAAVRISGSADAAEALLRQKSEGAAAGAATLEEQGAEPEEEADGRRSKRARVAAPAAVSLYGPHPLEVVLELRGSGSVPATVVTLTWLPELGVVTASASPDDEGTLLVSLFPGDSGVDTPNLANKARDPGFVFAESHASRPFMWAQHLAGLDFLPNLPPEASAEEAAVRAQKGIAQHQSQARARTIVTALQERVASRAALKEQLAALARCRVNREFVGPTPVGVDSFTLTRWKELTEDPEAAAKAQEESIAGAVEEGEVGGEDGEVAEEAPAAVDGAAPQDAVQNGEAVPMEEGEDVEERDRDDDDDDDDEDGEAVTHAEAAPEETYRDYPDEMPVAIVQAEEEEDPDDLPSEMRHGWRFFRAVLKRNGDGPQVEVEAEVAVTPDYPVEAPHFRLRLRHGVDPAPLPPCDVPTTSEGVEEPSAAVAATNDMLAVEQEVNVACVEALPEGISAARALEVQVARLVSSLERYAATAPWAGSTSKPGDRVGRARRVET